MGIDISGFSKAKRVAGRHDHETCDAQAHYPVGSYRKFLDGLKPGCYVAGGRTHYFYASYVDFDAWQNALAVVFHGVPSSEVRAHPKRFKGQPFFDIIALPEINDIGIGPTTSARLYAEFAENAKKAKK